MGQRANQFFIDADKLAGIPARARLALLARITSTEASALPDDNELLNRLGRAMESVLREFKGSDANADSLSNVADAQRLRRYLDVMVDLVITRALHLGNVDETMRRVTEAAALSLDVARVSVWLLDEGATRITCLDLFERPAARHSRGLVLRSVDHAPYFAAVRSERTIAAHDAQRDVRTATFTKDYLQPLGITSMLDVPIRVRGNLLGVICHEHVGPKRTWSADEERFGYLMSGLLSLAMER